MNKFQRMVIKSIHIEDVFYEIKNGEMRDISYRKARIIARSRLRYAIKNSSDDELEYFGLKRRRKSNEK
ncbi:hypothetical protein [Senegalia massiliensis]|uniref:hypothetical protein n=1 Tax=Senegalia massiliensis TaxID=1720316 RepID=UPI00102FD268|nr:hypothetical protein [Senegalia massiliensis]